MKLVQLSELRAGDVLLCYKAGKFAVPARVITWATNSDYTHAAICVDSSNAVESVLGGVRKVAVQSILKSYDHVAVFRQPDAWESERRVKALNAFTDSLVASGAKYNLAGVLPFVKRREVDHLALADDLRDYFTNPPTSIPTEKGKYFCSELVAQCFVAVGFIDASAAVLYSSKTTSPGAIGRDRMFGTFLGYASAVPNYQVAMTDEFFNAPTLEATFGDTDA